MKNNSTSEKRTGILHPMTELQRFLKDKLDPRGAASEMAEFLDISPGTISGWKKGAEIGFRAGLQIAWYFQIHPLDVYEMAEQPKLAEMFRGLFPDYEGNKVAEEDLYRDPEHAELHRKLQEILKRGAAPVKSAVTANVEVFYGYLDSE